MFSDSYVYLQFFDTFIIEWNILSTSSELKFLHNLWNSWQKVFPKQKMLNFLISHQKCNLENVKLFFKHLKKQKRRKKNKKILMLRTKLDEHLQHSLFCCLVFSWHYLGEYNLFKISFRLIWYWCVIILYVPSVAFILKLNCLYSFGGISICPSDDLYWQFQAQFKWKFFWHGITYWRGIEMTFFLFLPLHEHLISLSVWPHVRMFEYPIWSSPQCSLITSVLVEGWTFN